MRAVFLLNLKSLQTKYWFIPSIMALAATVLSALTVALDNRLGSGWVQSLPWLHVSQPVGARSLLSTIAGSMITVAGVTFSVTIAALATTASTFGPRLIKNFMQDRGNQVTLGTFISTFLYCLLVLRTVRSPLDGAEAGTSFVPQVSVLVALVFALASLGVLIYFIHHVPESLSVSRIVARLGRDLEKQIDELYPTPAQEGAPTSKADASKGSVIRSGRSGYVQFIDREGAVALARKHGLTVSYLCHPGQFVGAFTPVVRVECPDVPDQALRALNKAVVVGSEQSSTQDLLYNLDRLIEVAARALSPGVCDLFTATSAIDWLVAGLDKLTQRHVASPVRIEVEGGSVTYCSPGFTQLFNKPLTHLRPYVARDVNAARHLLKAMHMPAGRPLLPERRLLLRRHATAIRQAAAMQLSAADDRAGLDQAHAAVIRALG